MSLWEDCKPWVPPVIRPPKPATLPALPKPKPEPKPKPVRVRHAPAPLPRTNRPPMLDYRYPAGRLPMIYPEKKAGKPRAPSTRLARVNGHNVKLKASMATVEQIDAALERRDLDYKSMADLLGGGITHAMVRHWRSGNLPRMYLRAKGLVVA